MDCSPPGSSVHGISQARIPDWVAISFSRGYSLLRDRTRISCISCNGRRILYYWVTREALLPILLHVYSYFFIRHYIYPITVSKILFFKDSKIQEDNSNACFYLFKKNLSSCSFSLLKKKKKNQIHINIQNHLKVGSFLSHIAVTSIFANNSFE